MIEDLAIPNFLKRTKAPTMKATDTQKATPAEAPAPEQSAADLEHDAARLHREIETFDTRTKAIAVERAAKKKELEGVTRKLVQIRIKGMKT